MTPTQKDDVLFGTEFDGYDAPAPKLENEREADQHLRRAQALEREISDMAALFDAEIAALTERKKELIDGTPVDPEDPKSVRTGGLRSRVEWHLTALEQWHRAQYGAGQAGKTVKLPHGESRLRGSQPKIDVHDEDALRGFLVMHDMIDDVYPIKPPELSRAALKKAFEVTKGEAGSISSLVDENGQRVPGVRVIGLPDRFEFGGVKGKG